MTAVHHLDDETQSVVDRLHDSLRSLPAALQAAAADIEEGRTLAQVRGIDEGTLRTLHAKAAELFAGGHAAAAAPIAVHLAVHDWTNPKYLFLAAACARQLDLHELAAPLFGLVAAVDGNRPDGLFFMGECLEAAGHQDDAIEAFERAVEMARQDARHAALQERAEKSAGRLRAAR